MIYACIRGYYGGTWKSGSNVGDTNKETVGYVALPTKLLKSRELENIYFFGCVALPTELLWSSDSAAQWVEL